MSDRKRLGLRPDAFFVEVNKTEAVLVDPTEPLDFGCWVVLKLGDDFSEGNFVMGVVADKHPEKCKSLRVRLEKWGGTLHRCSRLRVFRVVSVHRSRFHGETGEKP
jgi:hypothetical protein